MLEALLHARSAISPTMGAIPALLLNGQLELAQSQENETPRVRTGMGGLSSSLAAQQGGETT